ncbi:MAG TPA: histidine kinase dimerization/phospho-acceptor domain-containing protein, partial [Phycisphaerae bacterium]|nr:histidine kinase dimerization/phospho-acceptor domain-containing protein [Phycisphaerae bacterium]
MLRSIRWTLQLWHAGILAVALASFGTALYIGISHAQFRRVDAELESAARTLAGTPIGPGPNDQGPRGRRGGGGFDNGGGGGGRGGFRGQPFDNGFDPGGGPGPGGFGGGGTSASAQESGRGGIAYVAQNLNNKPQEDPNPGPPPQGNFNGGPQGFGPQQGGFGGVPQGGFGAGSMGNGGPPQGGFGGGGFSGPPGGFNGQPGFGGQGPGFGGPGGGGFGGGGGGGGGGRGGRGGQGGPGGPDQRNGVEMWMAVPEDVLRRIGENEQDQFYFVVWGFDGRVLRTSSSELDVPTDEDRRMPATNGPWATATPVFRTRGILREVIVQGPFAVHVLVGKSLASEQTQLFYLRWELFGAGLAVMLVGLCGGWWLSVRATRPIEMISKTAREISASDLSKRVEIKESASELGVLAATLNETFDRLQTAFDRQVRFTGDASHELRTPLSVIHSQAELSLSRERSAPEYKQSLEKVLRAAKRMKSLVESLLVLARADAGKLVLTREKFDLVEAAEECVAMVSQRAHDRKVSIQTELKPTPVDADRTKMMQLITNLLSNAVQYNVEGGRVELFVGSQG